MRTGGTRQRKRVVQSKGRRKLCKHCPKDDEFRELIGRHHYLGHAVPFGAQIQYLAYGSRPERQEVGCLPFSSPAWRMATRDGWIGWDDEARKQNLQRVVNNSRFLIPPWVRVQNLASVILSQAMRRLGTGQRRPIMAG